MDTKKCIGKFWRKKGIEIIRSRRSTVFLPPELIVIYYFCVTSFAV